MKYRCTSCDHEFEHTRTKEKPRCPRCMGIHDVEPASSKEPAKKKKEKKPPVVPIVVVLLLAGVVCAYFLFDEEEAAETVSSGDDLSERLVALGISAEDVVLPFEVTDELEKFAETAAAGKDDEEGLAAMVNYLGKLKKSGHWSPHPQQEARSTGPAVASKMLEHIEKKGDTPYEATSYEMASLLLAMARSLDMDTRMAQIHSFEGEKSPADPGGKMGRFGVVFGEAKDKTPPLFDPYGGRFEESAKADFDILSDEDAVAVFYGHQALAKLMKQETSAALQKNDLAVKISPGSALHRVGRGLIFAASGAPAESLAEFEKAVKRRDDPVNRVNLADVLILTDPTGKKAESEIQAALTKMPDFARARASLGVIYYSRGEFEEAEAELAVAERLAPDSPEVMMAWAGYYVRKGMGTEAIEKAERAARLSGDSVSSLIALAGVYRATARFDEMRATLDKVFEITGSSSMASEIKRMFNYDPDEEEEEEAALADVDDVDAGLGNMELELGAEKKSPFGTGLKLGEGLGPGIGSSPDQSGPSLGGGGLKLDLNLQGN